MHVFPDILGAAATLALVLFVLVRFAPLER